ncbi:YfbM family protein [Micromonospora sp. WMMD961]|uniref:YfbM family protein n=1 Tax=Micromonospora sp. WMMD961 TaxID=3016100 RepID=UPI002416AD08|nr:YfbM family protein [Micromonospora sp. WMMD961]MDG4780721.1 YfbM family protein [Micromonospora sp. WMMD961]
MELIGRRLSSDELQAVLNNPEAVGALLYGDLDDDDAEMPDPELDLGKSWHAVHYLITGSAWGLGDGAAGAAILGGAEIGEDGGYGPARLLGPDAVRAVATELNALDVETLRTRYDADAMATADIYPIGWTNDEAEFDNLVVHLVELSQFYRTAADNGQAVLLAIT